MRKIKLKGLIHLLSFFSLTNLFAQTITLQSDSTTLNQKLCVNTQITEIKYSLSNDVTSVNVENLPDGVSSDFNSSTHLLTINGTPTYSNYYNFTITTSGGANPLSANGILDIEGYLPDGVDDQRCSSEPFYIEYSYFPSLTWTHNGQGSIMNENSATVAYVPSISDEGNTVKLTVSSSNSCGAQSKDFNYLILKTPTFTGNKNTNPNVSIQLIGSETSGFAWSSSSIDTATISNSGLVTGVGIGTTVITYTLTHSINNGQIIKTCQSSQNISVVQLITPTISGPNQVCEGSFIQLTGSETPAAINPWISSDPSKATITSNGVVTGIAAGSCIITYMNSTNGQTTFNFTVVSSPIVSAGSDITICLGLPVTLSGSGATTYSWTNSVTNGTSFTPTTAGTTTYTLTGTGSTGCSSTDDVVVTVNALPTVNAGNDVTICLGSPVTLSGSGATTYSWTNGLTNGTSFTPTTAGTTTYTLTGTTNSCSSTDDVIVTVNTLPEISNPGDQTVCDSYTLPIISGTNLSGNQKYYDKSQANYGAQLTGSISTTKTIWIYDTNNGCSNETSFQVTINKTPLITNPGNQTVCDSLLLPSIVGVSLSGNEKYYSNSKANNGVEITQPIKSNQIVWIYDEMGSCSNETSFQVTINKTPSITSPGNQTVCDSYNLPIITGLNLTGHQKYYNKSQAENGVQITGPITNTLNVWIYDSIKGCTNEIVFLVTVISTPNLVITNPSVVCVPQTVDITNSSIISGSSGGGIKTYWEDINSSNTIATPTAIAVSGTYYIKAENGNCSVIKPVTVVINPSPVLNITNPMPVTAPNTIDITLPAVTNGSTGNGTLTYWINANNTTQLLNPTSINMSGTYFIKSTLGNCFDIEPVTVTINELIIPNTKLEAYVIPKGETQQGLCDGEADVKIISGTAPYTYLYSNNGNSKATSNLCAGLKSVIVTDATNEKLVLDFLVSSPENVKKTSNLKDSTIVDSVYSEVRTNCLLNYTDIGSATIKNYTILSDKAILITWEVISGGKSHLIEETYNFSIHSGVFKFSLQLFCPNKVTGNFLTAYDQVRILDNNSGSSSNAGLNFTEGKPLKIYPNPFDQQLHFVFENTNKKDIAIRDISGKIVLTITNDDNYFMLDTRSLMSGHYIISIVNENGVYTSNFVKK